MQTLPYELKWEIAKLEYDAFKFLFVYDKIFYESLLKYPIAHTEIFNCHKYETDSLNGKTTYLGPKKQYQHSFNDEPSSTFKYMYKTWCKFGKLHRNTKDSEGNTLPAFISYNGISKLYNGSKEWYINGKLQRENDLPAIEYLSGAKQWYKDNQLHRDTLDADGYTLPAIIYSDGTKWWYKNGEFHRDEIDTYGNKLPACEFSDGTKHWYENGIFIREVTPNE